MGTFKIKARDQFICKVPASDADDAISALRRFLQNGDSLANMYVDPTIKDSVSQLAKLRDDEFTVEELHPKPKPQCAYCGQENPTKGKGDHVIARTFFAEEHRTDDVVYIKVPACPGCNASFSKDEEYYAFIIASSLQCGEHPEARALFSNNGPFHRAYLKGKGPLPAVKKRARETWVECGGLLLPTAQITIDYGRLNNLYDKIARGLFYYHLGTVFPDGMANYIAILDVTAWNGKFRELIVGSGLVEGNDVFRYSYAVVGEPAQFMMWLTSFYEGFLVAVLTMPERKTGDTLRSMPSAALNGLDAGLYRLLDIGESEANLQLLEGLDGIRMIDGPTKLINKNLLCKFVIEQSS